METQASELMSAVILATGCGGMTAVYNLLQLLAAGHPGQFLPACHGSWDHLRGKVSETSSGRVKVVPLLGLYNQSLYTKLTLSYQHGAAKQQQRYRQSQVKRQEFERCMKPGDGVGRMWDWGEVEPSGRSRFWNLEYLGAFLLQFLQQLTRNIF